MSKGFGKQPPSDMINIASIVSHRTGEPKVVLKWGKEEGQLTPEEAIAHASRIIEVAAGATIDAQIVRWGSEKLGVERTQVSALLQSFRKWREGVLPSMTLNIEGESLRPDTLRGSAFQMLEMVAISEAEVFLIDFLRREIDLEMEAIDGLIQEFRESRGAETLWSKSEEGEG